MNVSYVQGYSSQQDLSHELISSRGRQNKHDNYRLGQYYIIQWCDKHMVTDSVTREYLSEEVTFELRPEE